MTDEIPPGAGTHADPVVQELRDKVAALEILVLQMAEYLGDELDQAAPASPGDRLEVAHRAFAERVRGRRSAL
jgi:hypothetical protein